MTERSRIVLNALALRPGGSGVQTYIRELLRELPGAANADLVTVVQRDAAGGLSPSLEKILRPTAGGLRRGLHGIRPVGPCALTHGLNPALPLTHGAAKVITIHDLAYFDVPWASSRARATAARLQVRLSVRRADAIIAVSAFTAERVHALFNRDAVPIPLAPPAGLSPPSPEAIEAVRRTYRLPEVFVLHVGTIEPRKDVGTLADACRQVGVPLILAGARSPRTAPPTGAEMLGYVPGGALPGLYRAATVVAYTPRYEGFGLPPLEAMACGATLVGSDIPPLRETLRGAAELVEPGNADGLASLLSDLIHDGARREELGRKGLARVGVYRWKATANATADVYRSLGISC